MKKPRITALPLVVVAAVVALVVGTFGTAQAAGLTVTQVKKIAANVVDSKAPTLSVAHAHTADNAARVGGFLPSGLVRATSATNAGPGFYDSGFTFANLAAKSMTAPSAGILVISGDLNYNQLAGNVNPADIQIRGAVDGAAATIVVNGRDSSGSGIHGNASVSGAFPVTAGPHTVSLQVAESTTGGVFLSTNQITATFVPFGSAGGLGVLRHSASAATSGANR
jgi:hypothetical protein